MPHRNPAHPLTLFILKRFQDYSGEYGDRKPLSGLRNSARMVVDLLQAEGHRAALVEAIDGNCIDRLVSEYKPVRVVLEALWVTPAKLAELISLHPQVRWTVRIHSETPFLAGEGIAVEWVNGYLDLPGVETAFNSAQTAEDFSLFTGSGRKGIVGYLPNWYPLRKPRARLPRREELHVGCFGAVRPMKNQLIQAMAAARYAQGVGKALVFHVNGSRVEQNGGGVLKNIEALFATGAGQLETHPWMPHDEFLELVSGMDICLQVSLSESFNIVSADAVSMGIPLVGSEAIRWLPKRSRAKVDSAGSIVAAMYRADETAVAMNHAALEDYLEDARDIWNRWIRG